MKKSHAYHLSIAVSDGRVSKKFYHKVFAKLGWKVAYEDAEAAGYSDGAFTLWVVPADKKKKAHTFHGVGFHHFAIGVPQKKLVDEFYAWCKKSKIPVVDAPAAYPQYAKGYYAMFFTDPDGMKLEVVYKQGQEVM